MCVVLLYDIPWARIGWEMSEANVANPHRPLQPRVHVECPEDAAWLPSRSTRRVVCLTHYRVSGLIALAGAIAKINGNMGHTWALDGPHEPS